MRLIGFAGYKGSGKTYISNQFKNWCESHGYISYLFSFNAVAVGGGSSRKSRHETRQEELIDQITRIAIKEKEQYSNLCKWELESEFKETIVIIDDISFLDDIKFIQIFNGDIIFVDASQRLDLPSLQTAKEHLANAVTFGKYPLNLFSKVLNNNHSKKHLDRSLAIAMPEMVIM